MSGSTLETRPLHTPGPWKAEPFRLKVGDQTGPLMSYLAGGRGTVEGMTVSVASERVADHHLCAAAPDLLLALERVYPYCDMDEMPAELKADVIAALRKAAPP